MRGTANAQQDISSKQDRLTVSSGSVNINGTTIYPPTSAGTSGQVWVSDGSGQGTWKTADTTVTEGSTNLITSDAVYKAVEEVAGATLSYSLSNPIIIDGQMSSSTNGQSSVIKYSTFTLTDLYRHGKNLTGTATRSSSSSTSFCYVVNGNTNVTVTVDLSSIIGNYTGSAVIDYILTTSGSSGTTIYGLGSYSINCSIVNGETSFKAATIGTGSPNVYCTAGSESSSTLYRMTILQLTVP